MDDFKSLGLRVVAHYPILNKITGKPMTGYVLSQIMHWNGVQKGKEFYKTDKEFADELEIGVAEFRSAKKALIESQLIAVVKRGIPSTSYYSVNIDLLTSLCKSDTRVYANQANCVEDVVQTNSENTSENTQRIDTQPSSLQEYSNLPGLIGKTPLARLVKVYSIKFRDLYGFEPQVMNWAQLGRFFKDMLKNYTEWQIAAMILLHFDWHGASGDDDFTFNRLSDRCFPLEWVPKASNAYRAYLQNSVGLEWDNNVSVRTWVTKIIQPLYKTQTAQNHVEPVR